MHNRYLHCCPLLIKMVCLLQLLVQLPLCCILQYQVHTILQQHNACAMQELPDQHHMPFVM